MVWYYACIHAKRQISWELATNWMPKRCGKTGRADVSVLDAAFVDDEAIALLASAPTRLDAAMETTLKHLVKSVIG